MRHGNDGSEGEKLRRRKRGSVDCKAALMDAVVSLTASSGVESLSTRAIVAAARDVSTDAYIYTIFGSKENLLSEAFLREDTRYEEAMEQASLVLFETGMAFESRLRHLWHGVWNWLVAANEQTCLFLTRYSSSCFFDDMTQKKHQDIWQPLAEKWKGVFGTADTVRLTETTESLLLHTACLAFREHTKDNGLISENGYRMLEGMLCYFARNERMERPAWRKKQEMTAQEGEQENIKREEEQEVIAPNEKRESGKEHIPFYEAVKA